MKLEITPPSWVFGLVMLALAALSGCSESIDSATGSSAVNSGEPAAVTERGITPTKPRQNKGTVKSNQPAGGYSYLEVDIDGDTFWLATSISSVKPGDRVAWRDYAMMTNFTSKALQREFNQIMFVDRIMSESESAIRPHSGTVIESMNAAGYSYIRVEENGANVWLAAPETKIEIGQSISWSGGAPMRNFTSRSLQRNFDEIFFVNAIQGS